MYCIPTLQKVRSGFYTAQYFLNTRKILIEENNFSIVTMQVFQKRDKAVLCGVNEVMALLKNASGIYKNNKWKSMWSGLTIHSLNDGDHISAYEPVLHITGPYVSFAHLESLYLGILARRTLVATNTRNIVQAANGKQVYFFADRFDHFLNQEGDGYAAHIGGISKVCTQAQAIQWNGESMGTMPHALIAINNGDTVKAAQSFLKTFPHIPLVVLVDFQNDCVRTSLATARFFGNTLRAVRLDTSENLIDKYLTARKPRSAGGVSPALVFSVRRALNASGFGHVKIIVSGGFTEGRIRQFEKDHVPVDGYGVGSALLKGRNDFTADIVKVNGKYIAKEGRGFKANIRMRRIH